VLPFFIRPTAQVFGEAFQVGRHGQLGEELGGIGDVKPVDIQSGMPPIFDGGCGVVS
jgi:hypothetical protein